MWIPARREGRAARTQQMALREPRAQQGWCCLTAVLGAGHLVPRDCGQICCYSCSPFSFGSIKSVPGVISSPAQLAVACMLSWFQLAFLLCVFAGLIGSDASHRPGDGNVTVTSYTDVFLTCWMANSKIPKCRLFLTEAFLVHTALIV